jgi:hypothetical protein
LARQHFGQSKIKQLFRAAFINEFDEALEAIEKAAQEITKELYITALEGVPLFHRTMVALLNA